MPSQAALSSITDAQNLAAAPVTRAVQPYLGSDGRWHHLVKPYVEVQTRISTTENERLK